MATPYYRSPTSVPLPAALLPARLAEEHDEVLWRAVSPGEIEVAARSGRCVERLRVHSDGTTTPLGTSTHRSRPLKAILFGLLAAGAAAVLAVVESDDKWFVTFFVLLFTTTIADEWAGSLRRHLKRELRIKHEWLPPTKLHGWTPTTTGQLAAVEEIATNLSGEAFVSDPGEATIAVVAGTHRYELDAAGNVVLHEKNRFRAMPRDEEQEWHKITYVPDGG